MQHQVPLEEEDAHEEFPLPSKASKNDNASTYLDGRMEIHGASGRQEFFSSKDSDCFQLAEDAGTL